MTSRNTNKCTRYVRSMTSIRVMAKVETYETKRNGTRYRVRFWLGGRQLSKTFATVPEAERFARDLTNRGAERALADLEDDQESADEDTLDEWAVRHFAAMTRASAGTVARYRRIYERTWSPTLGHLRLSAITRTDVAAALNGVPGSDKTVMNAWAVLTYMLKLAAQDGLITRSPCVGVAPGRRSHESVEHRYLTHEEFWAIYTRCPDYWKPLLMLLIGTGVRWGEAAALEVGDVNKAKRTVSVTKAMRRDPDNPSRSVVGATKTRRSRRVITLPDETYKALEPLLDRPRKARLFVAPQGGELRHKTFYADIWVHKCLGMDKGKRKGKGKAVVDPQPRIHDLRHTHVAWLIAAGTPLPVIQARLGHESITTTINTYGGLLPDLQRAAAAAADVVLAGRPVELQTTGE